MEKKEGSQLGADAKVAFWGRERGAPRDGPQSPRFIPTNRGKSGATHGTPHGDGHTPAIVPYSRDALSNPRAGVTRRERARERRLDHDEVKAVSWVTQTGLFLVRQPIERAGRVDTNRPAGSGPRAPGATITGPRAQAASLTGGSPGARLFAARDHREQGYFKPRMAWSTSVSCGDWLVRDKTDPPLCAWPVLGSRAGPGAAIVAITLRPASHGAGHEILVRRYELRATRAFTCDPYVQMSDCSFMREPIGQPSLRGLARARSCSRARRLRSNPRPASRGRPGFEGPRDRDWDRSECLWTHDST